MMNLKRESRCSDGVWYCMAKVAPQRQAEKLFRLKWFVLAPLNTDFPGDMPAELRAVIKA
jgi:hypothetical protein